ncbi:MAG: peptide chain release factor N(5)-glutamine methyltransferase [Bacteroidales bacterium]|nr:peptide chain release factor N(5)-glutamine methyltransferase [Bacteroidales bacterium]
MTLKDIQNEVRNRLAGIYENGELKTVSDMLLEYHTGYDYIHLNMHSGKRVEEDTCRAVMRDTELLCRYYPIQYVTGRAFFFDMQLYVNPHVLIPRMETEELVQWILQSEKNNGAILDMCTGSGCIALALAKQWPQAKISACDISADALQVAVRNAYAQNLAVRFIQMDVLKPYEEQNGCPQYDVIVSNPPYVCRSEQALMSKQVLEHEPHEALFVEDEHPLVFYHAIADTATRILKKGGSLYFEINERFGEETVQLMREHGFSQIELKKDINEKNRMVKGKL